MNHPHSLRLVPADLDRLHAALLRAFIARPIPYQHAFELVADVEAAAAAVAVARMQRDQPTASR